MIKALRLMGYILLCQLSGAVGSLVTADKIQSWYLGVLTRPSFAPPNWLFGPVWITLYTLMGIALFLVLERPRSPERARALRVFFLQLGLNALWTPVFFGLEAPFAGFIVILLLCVATIWNIVVFYRVQRVAAYLLVPYLLWVSFASVLNGAIWILNR
jgi:benzodiazapine receptor